MTGGHAPSHNKTFNSIKDYPYIIFTDIVLWVILISFNSIKDYLPETTLSIGNIPLHFQFHQGLSIFDDAGLWLQKYELSIPSRIIPTPFLKVKDVNSTLSIPSRII